MDQKLVSLCVLIVFLSLFSMVGFNAAVGSRTIFVPTDFSTIQAAINNATDGDTIFVYNGTYHENLVVNKSIALVGQDEGITVIDGDGVGTVIRVTVNNVSIVNFTVRNSGFSASMSGISVDANYVSVSESTLTGNYIGLYLGNSDGCVVSRCGILENHLGISLEVSENCIVEDNNITGNTEAGIALDYSGGIEARDNNISENGLYGVRVQHSQNNVLSGNLVKGHETGMILNMSGDNRLRNNAIQSNRYNFGVHGMGLSDFLQDIDVSNTVGDKPMYYLVNKEGVVINSSSNAGYIALVNSSDIHVKGLDLEGNREGMLLAYSYNCEMEENRVAGNLHGVFLYRSHDNKLVKGEIVDNHDGVGLVYSRGNLISGNLVAYNEDFGIDVESSNDNVMSNNNVSANGGDGLYVHGSSNCSVSGNRVLANGAGVRLQFSDRSKVESNLIRNNNWDGIYMVGSDEGVVQGNDVSNNVGYGVRFLYCAFSVVDGNTLSDNKVDGVYLYKCYVVSVRSNVLLHNVVGVYSYSCFNCTIAFNYISSHSREGVKVAYSEGIIASENTMLGNGRAGLGLFYSSNNVIEGNVVDRNMHHGIWLDGSSHSIVAGNNVTYNNWRGVYLYASNSCAVEHNLVVGNMNGLYFWLADNNTVTNNIVKENRYYGIHLSDCVYNKIFHNSFSNNTRQVGTLGKCENSWDDGYPSGGNYWSDYGGVDLYKGPFQNLAGSDGIGDTAYVIEAENSDRYPLMTPYRVHDVEVVSIFMGSSKIYVGWVVDVNVAVKNVGGYIETFNLSVFWDDVLLGTRSVENLHVGETTVITYVWNTSGLVPCHNYTVKAEADAVQGEADFENNVCLIEVKVDMVGDVNGDGIVNIRDITLVARAFGSRKGDVRYRWDCDLNGDDAINIVDVTSVAKNFGEECSV